MLIKGRLKGVCRFVGLASGQLHEGETGLGNHTVFVCHVESGLRPCEVAHVESDLAYLILSMADPVEHVISLQLLVHALSASCSASVQSPQRRFSSARWTRHTPE